jgi:hypothetical protein
MHFVYFAQVPKPIALTCNPPRRTTIVRVDLGGANDVGPIDAETKLATGTGPSS